MNVNEIVENSCESKHKTSTGKASSIRQWSRQAGKRRQWARREEEQAGWDREVQWLARVTGLSSGGGDFLPFKALYGCITLIFCY